jgi:hypothetical protein
MPTDVESPRYATRRHAVSVGGGSVVVVVVVLLVVLVVVVEVEVVVVEVVEVVDVEVGPGVEAVVVEVVATEVGNAVGARRVAGDAARPSAPCPPGPEAHPAIATEIDIAIAVAIGDRVASRVIGAFSTIERSLRGNGEDHVDDRSTVIGRQRELALAPIDGRERGDALQHAVEMIVGTGHDATQQIAGTGDGVDLDDLDDRLQRRNRFVVRSLADLEGRERENAQPRASGIDIWSESRQHTLGGETIEAGVHRAPGDADETGEVGRCRPGVAPEGLEELEIGAIERPGHRVQSCHARPARTDRIASSCRGLLPFCRGRLSIDERSVEMRTCRT